MSTKKSDAVKFLEKIAGGPLTFGRMIASIRTCEETSQSEFAKKLDISRQNLCDLEKGRVSISPKRASLWAEKLGYSETYFVSMALQESVNAAGLQLKVTVTATRAVKKAKKKRVA